MTTSDFKQRQRLTALEHEARHHPRRHALRLAALVMVGYAYPLALLLLSFALVVAVLAVGKRILHSSAGEVAIVFLVFLVASLAVVLLILRAFWVEVPAPMEVELRPGEAGPLRDLVEVVREKMAGPRLDSIHFDMNFNAGVVQRRRFGLWGPCINHLVLGLPLLSVLTADELRSVLGHEFGHLHGRHATVRNWVIRVYRTWEVLLQSGKTRGAQTMVFGWFVRWYGRYLSESTLALRRIHEYEADRFGANLSGKDVAAQALVKIDWLSYRLEHSFWPAVLHAAKSDPIPPTNLLREMTTFFDREPAPHTLERWRSYEQKKCTPITAEHPALKDRLNALGCGSMLATFAVKGTGVDSLSGAPDSALSLLGNDAQRLLPLVNASWKTQSIQRWRLEHAYAKYQAEHSEQPVVVTDGAANWEDIRAQTQSACPDDAIVLLESFLSENCVEKPAPAGASHALFMLGQLLLQQNDETAIGHLEKAMSADSVYASAALSMMLDYYRNAGRDEEADGVRARLESHEKLAKVARRERAALARSDRFVPHDLKPKKLDAIRRILFFYPRVRIAYIARREVQHFADQPNYVIALDRESRLFEVERTADHRLIESLYSQIDLPCTIVILSRVPRSIRERIVVASGTPLHITA